MASMRADIRLAIVTLYCLCSIGLITPFAIYRLAAGEILIGVADLSIVSVFALLMLMAWRSGKTQLAADLTACVATSSVMFMVLVLDISHLWTFSTLVGNFLMARKRVAILASTIIILSIGLQPTVFALQTERFTFLAVATMVSLFSLIFATRVGHRHGQLSDMLSRDALTGSFNRRALDHDLQAICHKPGPVKDSLVMMDLDNFKRLNDNFGHDSGDQVLMGLARIVELQTREKDRFYRYGGEEFALLLPGTALEGARAASDKLHQALRQELNGPDGIVTVSMGLAERRPGEAPNDWLKRADEALLSAKRTGKDRVVVAD
jgi:diguanylate cyclase